MSNRAIDAVLAYSDSTGSARLLMLLIANGVNKDTATYYAKTTTLAHDAKCTPRWVELLIRKCIDRGELIAAHQRGVWTTFYIPIFPGEDGYAPIPCDSADHLCSGEHTPLSVNRDELYRKDAEERKREARSRFPRRTKAANDSSRSANDSSSTPANDSSRSANDSSRSANDSSRSANDSSLHISKYHSYTQVLSPDIYPAVSTSLGSSSTDEMSADARTPTPPMPPAPPLPAEQRELWATVRRDLARHMTGARLRHFDGAHLYALDPASAAYALYVPSHAAAQQAALYEQDMARAIRISTGHPDVSITVLTGQYREAAHA